MTAGMVCAHHHLYSSLARGMPATPQQPKNFVGILENVWWRLDAALDLEMIYWSAALGATEALLCGTTCIIDHHESPNAIEGSLATIAKACRDVGVRVNASYGVTDRWNFGVQSSAVDRRAPMTLGAKMGLAENDQFLRDGNSGMVGVHAAFTCGDETLEAASELAVKHRVGVHIHVAEDLADKTASARLERLAQDNWLLVHGVHIDRPLRGRIVHNPRSNMNNSVGYGKPSKQPNKILLGTDGIGSDMLEEARLAYARLREFDVSETPDTVAAWLHNGYEIFPQALHDEVTWSYDHADSPWHVAYTPGMRALDVIVDGEKILSDGVPQKIDLAEVRARACEQSTRLHERL